MPRSLAARSAAPPARSTAPLARSAAPPATCAAPRIWHLPDVLRLRPLCSDAARRLLTVVVAVVGVVATVATSQPTTTGVVTGQTTLDIPLDASRPAVAFAVTTTVQATAVALVELRAVLRVDDDGVPANDERHLLDVGLLPDGASLPDDVDVAGDATMASVGEGAFGVTTALAPDAVTAGSVTLLVVRLRPDVPRARVNVRLTASAQVDDSTEAVVTVDAAARPDDGDTADGPS